MKIRALQFTRYTTLPEWEKEIGKDLYSKNPIWITLGHFDTMVSYQVNNNSNGLFENIAVEQEKTLTENSNDKAYSYLMYLLSDHDDSTIWNSNYPFLAISRIHFYQNIDLEDIRKKITESLTQNKEINSICYRSADLTDLVIIIASQKINSLIRSVLNLRANYDIGKSYTYFCIRVPFKNLIKNNNEIVPLINMRFSVNSTKLFKKQLNVIKKTLNTNQIFVISGRYDIEVVCKNAPIKNLLNLYKQWFQLDTKSTENLCFSDVSTFLGCENGDWSAKDLEITKIWKKTTDLIPERDNLLKKWQDNQQHPQWLSRFFDLFVTFIRMSGTVIADEYVSLIYPSAVSILDYFNNFFDKINNYTERIIYFLNAFEHLNETILLSEGQLNIYPEYHSRTSRISFVFIEYILAFLYLCEDFLIDDSKNTHNLFIVPEESKRIETAEIINTMNSKGKLISITVPYKILTKSRYTLQTLCHEISHFVGEELRSREERLYYYSKALCAIIAGLVFHSDNIKFVDFLVNGESGSSEFQGLFSYLKQSQNNTIQEITKEASDWCYWVFSDKYCPTQYDHILRKFISKYYLIGNDVLPRKKIGDKIINLIFDFCEMYSKLFREIFADLCMIRILNIPMNDYVDIICSDVIDENGNIINNKNAIRMDALRIYIGLKSCGATLDETYFFGYNFMYKAVIAVHLDYIEKIYDKEDNLNHVSIKSFLDYANCCIKKIDQRIVDKRNEVEAIRKAFCFATASDNSSIDNLEYVLNVFRKRVLNM